MQSIAEKEEHMNLRMMEIDASNVALLSNFLYEAIFVPSGRQPPSRDILADPQLQVYVHDFGKQTGDFGLFAEVEGVIAGAVWHASWRITGI